MSPHKKIYKCVEIARLIGVAETVILQFIEREWLMVEEPGSTNLDDEDLARARLICQLQNDLGVNDEAVPIILHLIDQLHHFRFKINKLT